MRTSSHLSAHAPGREPLCRPRKPAAGLGAMGGSPEQWLRVLCSVRTQGRQHLPEQLRQHHPYFMALSQHSVLTAFCPPEILSTIGDILGCHKRKVVFLGSSC